MEGMPIPTLAAKKKGLVQELNGFIAQKKAATEQAESMSELVGTSKKGATPAKTKESTFSSLPLPLELVASYHELLGRN
jgi:hypothetical protein